jgi:hypothetical protein
MVALAGDADGALNPDGQPDRTFGEGASPAWTTDHMTTP